MEFSFDSQIIEWRGPAPFFYAPMPLEAADEVRKAAKLVSYGWGVIPVEAAIGGRDDIDLFAVLTLAREVIPRGLATRSRRRL